MPDKDIDQLGELQAAVMEILWRRQEATVKEVQDTLPGEPAYTTVLTILQKLTKAGWAMHRRDGRSYIYRPACSRAEAGRSALRRFVEQVFGGDRLLALQQMISEEPLDPGELEVLRQLVERHREEPRDD